MKILRGGGGLRKTPERGTLKKIGGGGSENLYTSKPTGGGAPKKFNR